MKYPISPDYVQAAGEQLTPLFQDLEDYIIEKICEQFRTGEANATALEMIRELQRRGLPLAEIEKQIKKTLGITQKELDAIFEDAIARNELYYGDVLDKMGLAGDSYQAEAMRLEAEAIARQTAGTFMNLTQSMGFAMPNATGQIQFYPIAEAYQNALNRATVRVLSGAEDYNTAVRHAVRELTDSGIQFVDYESGHHDRADVAARRAVMTGVVQISSKYTEQTAEEVPTPYREVSAHAGARDIDKPNPWSNHKAWQGKVYSIRTGDKYPSIYAVCGWGEVDGLEGANCRHVHYPFWEGISERTYTDEELANIDKPPFEFEGQTYTTYEATQQQRKIERALRSVKRRMIGEKAAGQDYTASAVKYRRLKEEYKKFTKASGLRSQEERGNIPEFGPKEAKDAFKAATGTNNSAVKATKEKHTPVASNDVLQEYIDNAKPGTGTITYETGYDVGLHADEIDAANFIHRRFGGNIKCLTEKNSDHTQTPDFEWTGKLWELKCPTTAKAADAAARKAKHQIETNPGGIVLNYKENPFVMEELIKVIEGRMRTYAGKKIDVMILSSGDVKAILRYGK